MRFTELETERLLLRKLYESDFPIVYDWLGNNENMKYYTMNGEIVQLCEQTPI